MGLGTGMVQVGGVGEDGKVQGPREELVFGCAAQAGLSVGAEEVGRDDVEEGVVPCKVVVDEAEFEALVVDELVAFTL